MLQFSLTKKNAGIELWGDFVTLENTYNLIHKIVDQSQAIPDKESFVLGLAYDIRKAFMGARLKDQHLNVGEDKVNIYGEEILWPVLLLQVGILRYAMSFIAVNKLELSLMLQLEYIVETALEMAAPTHAKQLIELMRVLGGEPYEKIAEKLDSRCQYFIRLTPKDRLKRLADVMLTFGYMYEILPAGLAKNQIKPEVFLQYDGQEWPEFEM